VSRQENGGNVKQQPVEKCVIEPGAHRAERLEHNADYRLGWTAHWADSRRRLAKRGNDCVFEDNCRMAKNTARQHQWDRGVLKPNLAHGNTCDVPQASAMLAHDPKRDIVASFSLIEQNGSEAPDVVRCLMQPVVEAMQYLLNRRRAKMSQHALCQ
jgi:hypothetical protein